MAQYIKVLGVDPGTHVLGWGVIEGNRNTFALCEFGVIKPKTMLPLPDRLLFLFEKFQEILEKFLPDAVVCEDPFFFKDIRAAVNIGRAWSIVAVLARKRGIKFSTYSPLEVKKSITSYGRATKEQVNQQVKRIFNVSKKIPLDASDAIACAFCYMSDLRNYKG
ncbi:MAG: crossover junction endodeoxyribonuclease RuvC [Elusimicrobia bacterium]|nr:crossover junction endodeoxyribonuclease RuvC [Elusimicrobiota bacterium]